MDNSQICINIKYQGRLKHFKFARGTCFEDIITRAMYRFDIPAQLHKSLVITNFDRYVFDKQLFEYFILLFPQPHLIFYLRHRFIQLERAEEMKWIRNVINPSNLVNSNSDKKRSSNGNSSNGNNHINQETRQDDQPTYNAVPVRRQNCFLGPIPKNVKRLDGEEKAEISRRIRLLTAMQKERSARRLREKRNASAFKNAIRL